MRDTAEEYREIREEKHNVGLPCLVIDEGIFILDSPEMAKEIVEKYKLGE